MTEETENYSSARKDIFSRPSEFRRSTVLAVWEKGARVEGKPNHRRDWRNGNIVGPWKPPARQGEPLPPRDGVWDIGHIEPWYKVVTRLKKVEGITREQVLDEFNDLDNLAPEDPETNRALGHNSRLLGVDRLPYEEEEKVLFSGKPEEFRIRFRQEIDEKEKNVETRLTQYEGRASMTTDNEKIYWKQPERVIVWDTETTGLSPKNGDKIVEIGALELVDGKPTGKEFHQYINPGRRIPSQATKVHGITDEMVKGEPPFEDIAEKFLAFVGDSPLVAHNASFDMRFINAELEAAGHEPIGNERKVDTLRLARKLLPGRETYTLDSLAEHFGVDTSEREKHHGGMVDTRILAEVYQKLTGLAKERDVDVLSLTAEKAAALTEGTGAHTAQLASKREEDEFNKAVRDEISMHPAWAEEIGKGFSGRVAAREEAGYSGGIA